MIVKIDTLIRFLDQEGADSFDEEIGFFDETLDALLTDKDGWTIDRIGTHSYEDDDGNSVTVEGIWIMLLSYVHDTLPDSVALLTVERDPVNPAIPNRVWAHH